MVSKLSAEEVWKQIERLHDPEKNRVANTYAITLNNGITYLYSASHDNRLLSIDHWFEGFVKQYGSVESGFPYILYNDKDRLVVKKIYDKDLIDIYTFRKSDRISKCFIEDKSADSIEISESYFYHGSEYVAFTYNLNYKLIVDVSRQKIEDSFKIGEFPGQHVVFQILQKAPFNPAKYLFGTLDAKSTYGDSMFLSFLNLANKRMIKLTNQRYRYIRFGSECNGYTPIFRNKRAELLCVYKYEEESDTLVFIRPIDNFFYVVHIELKSMTSHSSMYEVLPDSFKDIPFIKFKDGETLCIEKIRYKDSLTINIKNRQDLYSREVEFLESQDNFISPYIKIEKNKSHYSLNNYLSWLNIEKERFPYYLIHKLTHQRNHIFSPGILKVKYKVNELKKGNLETRNILTFTSSYYNQSYFDIDVIFTIDYDMNKRYCD